MKRPMKMIALALMAGALLASSGCVVVGGSEDHHRVHSDGAGTGVDHGEYPGDMDHGDTMQH